MFGTVRVYPFYGGTYDLEWSVQGKEGEDKSCFNLSPTNMLTKFTFAKWKHSPWIKTDTWGVSDATANRIRFAMLGKADFINY